MVTMETYFKSVDMKWALRTVKPANFASRISPQSSDGFIPHNLNCPVVPWAPAYLGGSLLVQARAVDRIYEKKGEKT